MSITEYILRFDEQSRYAPHMFDTNEIKAGGIKGVPFAEIANRALKAEQAENDILDEKKTIRER